MSDTSKIFDKHMMIKDHIPGFPVKEVSDMLTMGSIFGQMCTNTMVSGWFAFISWIYL